MFLALACSKGDSAEASRKETPALPSARVVITHDPEAIQAFKPRLETIRRMSRIAITNLTRTAGVSEAWHTLIKTNETIGIKVHSGPGSDTGTRPAVVASLIEQLLIAGVAPGKIIVWDRQRADLRRAGFNEMTANYGVRVEGSVNAGFDPDTYYDPDQPVLGQLLWSDLEFGRKGENVGRRSFASKLLQEMNKIIVVTPLLNHNTAGVFGNIYNLSIGSVDNVLRFENDYFRLKKAVPEIYALPWLSDRVVLCVTDALVCQYEGEQRGLLHYSMPLNELRFSFDPVALDVLSLRELERERQRASTANPSTTQHGTSANLFELMENAALLELGVHDFTKISVDHVP
jgi:hypothetical protein